jgi:2'-5' RNA ligase
MSAGLRVFLAVPVAGEAVLTRLSELLDELRALRGVHPVPQHQLHFTLKFFESLAEGDLSAVRSAAARAAGDAAAFRLELKGVGVFPPKRPGRVVWAGCGMGSEELTSLARRVEDSFTVEGFAAEPRPFAPHLTLARVKDPRAAREAAVFATARASFDAGELDVKELVLFQSVLGRDGAAYTPLGRFGLRSASS